MYTTFPDVSRISMGTGNDFYMEFTSADMVMNCLAGDFYIQNYADDKDIILRSDDGSGGVTAYLTLDGSAKYVRIPDDGIRLTLGAGNDLAIFVITSIWLENRGAAISIDLSGSVCKGK